MKKLIILLMLLLTISFNLHAQLYDPCADLRTALLDVNKMLADGDYKRALEVLERFKNKPEMQKCEDFKSVDYQISEIKKKLEDNPGNLYVENQLKCKSTNPIIVNLVNNMVKVDGGTFTMGCTKAHDSDADDDEAPEHQVTLSDFYIGKYEVTQEEWEAVMGENPSDFKGKPDSNKRPVEKVSWDDCQDFIKKLNDLTGLNFRLPTEAEWEYAARVGNKSGKTKYSGGASVDAVAWYEKNAYYVGKDGKRDESRPDYGTHPVGKKVPNELGLYDMSGNVYEWCQDWYDSNYYKNSPSSNPCNTVTASYRVFRGGSWYDFARNCRVSSRCFWYPDSRYYNLGLRLALVSPDNNYDSNNNNNNNGESTAVGTDAGALIGKHMDKVRAKAAAVGTSATNTVTSKALTSNTTNPIIVNLVNNMVKVDGGTFTMGATDEQGWDAEYDEAPEHQVTLSDFYIGKYEVTQEEWEAVKGGNPSDFKGNKRPVECVSWDDCQDFIKKLNDLTGLNFRLPTEAEWEFAARGGTKSNHYKYAGSNTLRSVAWYGDNSGRSTHPVGKKAPNELGLYDMSGNVWEWCQDWYDNNYYKNSPSSNPCNTVTAPYRVSRGGSRLNLARSCRVSNRRNWDPGSRDYSLGLRLAL